MNVDRGSNSAFVPGWAYTIGMNIFGSMVLTNSAALAAVKDPWPPIGTSRMCGDDNSSIWRAVRGPLRLPRWQTVSPSVSTMKMVFQML